MRWLALVLIVLFFVLQYKLWAGDGGLSDVHRLRQAVEEQKATNQKLLERNQALEGEVKDLKQGMEALEERARSELGMVKKDETFYQVVDDDKDGADKKH
jgi:cell division protein FtsB